MKPPKRILWLDLETTGLNPQTCLILEVGAVVTDEKLNAIDTFSSVIFRPMAALRDMDLWCWQTHANSGLLDEVVRSTSTTESVEYNLVRFISEHFEDRKANLAGNSVHFDKSFLAVSMPKVHALLSHRILDVSSFNLVLELMHDNRWNKESDTPHRAMQDVEDSIANYKKAIKLLVEKEGKSNEQKST